jgi:dTDP-4-dehydrorhamnose reductase
MKILIFGINGNLGRYLTDYFKTRHDICSGKNLNKILFRLPNNIKIKKLILKFTPDVIINLVAYADVKGCELNIERALKSNVKAVKSIVSSINSKLIKIKPHLIHISTDHVYDGEGFKNEKETKLLNNYAITKFLGEKETFNCNSTILRTNYIGKSRVGGRLSLSDWIVNSISNKKEIAGFTDIKFNPIHVNTLCKIIDLVCKKKINGTFNVGAKGYISKYDYAIFLAKKLNLNIKLIKKGKSSSNNTVRPSDMRMCIKKFEEIFHYKMPSMYDELIKNLKDYDCNEQKN